MVSLRLLAVLSVAALLHCAPIAEDVPKCESWAWKRNGNNPAEDWKGNERKEIDCLSGVCVSISVHYEDSQWIRSEAGCVGARPLAASYECAPPKYVGGGQRNTELSCFCKPGTDSVCNRPELMFDPEGDDGQKGRVLELRKIGIITEANTTDSGRQIAFKFDENFIKTVEPSTDATTGADVPTTSTMTSTIPPSTTTEEEDEEDEDEDQSPKDRDCGPEHEYYCAHRSKCTLHWAPLAQRWDPSCECAKGYIGHHCDQPYDPNVFAAPDREEDEETESSMSRTVARPALLAAVLSIAILWR